MIDYLAELESEIAALRARIAEVETAARVIRDIDQKRAAGAQVAVPAKTNRKESEAANHIPNNNRTPTGESGASDSGDTRRVDGFEGKTVKEAAIAVLEKSAIPLHYSDVYKLAAAGGYKSGRGNGGSPESFWSIMKRDPVTFEAVGGGKFSLKGEKDG